MAVDKIAERLQIPGVYGPLYRLFTIKNAVFSTAVELTAGTR
jgi:structural maintenance of chromosome 3 (chondroitin sulfate proteoglycan 6)